MNTHKIETPIGKRVVEIKDWITGREAEYMDEPMYEAMAVKADMTGKTDIGAVDIKKIVTEGNHRKIQTFVVSVDGITENILDKVLDMHEEDTRFVLETIDEQRKKK